MRFMRQAFQACRTSSLFFCHPVYNDVGVVKIDEGVDAEKRATLSSWKRFDQGLVSNRRARSASPPIYSVRTATMSKYPPAEPEALWVAAPSKGADRDPKSKPPDPSSVVDCGITKLRARTTTQAAWATVQGSLPELSNFGCLPGRAGGTPISLAFELPPSTGGRLPTQAVGALCRTTG